MSEKRSNHGHESTSTTEIRSPEIRAAIDHLHSLVSTQGGQLSELARENRALAERIAHLERRDDRRHRGVALEIDELRSKPREPERPRRDGVVGTGYRRRER